MGHDSRAWWLQERLQALQSHSGTVEQIAGVKHELHAVLGLGGLFDLLPRTQPGLGLEGKRELDVLADQMWRTTLD